MNKELLQSLVCPVSGGDLVYDIELDELRCEKSKLAYPVRDGIPIMIPDEARQIVENTPIDLDILSKSSENFYIKIHIPSAGFI